MAYVFDTSSFSVIGNYYPEQFPTFWEKFDQAATAGTIISVREVRRELDFYVPYPHLSDWVKDHGDIFSPPISVETEFVQDIFSVQAFPDVSERERSISWQPGCGSVCYCKSKSHKWLCCHRRNPKTQTLQESRTFAIVLGLIAQTFKDSWKEKVGGSNLTRY